MIGLLSDQDRAARIGAAGRDYVKQNFSFGRLVADVEQLYSNLLKG
jgi:glycosyltransferase involved in cell wall biosynthesis